MKKRVIFSIIIATILLNGCKTAPNPNNTQTHIQQNPEVLLHQAQLASKETQYQYLLDAASLLWMSQEKQKAADTVAQIDEQTVAANDQAYYYRLNAEIALWKEDPSALEYLNKLTKVDYRKQLSDEKLKQYQAQAYILNANYTEALRIYISLQNKLSGEEAKANITQTWQTLLQIPYETLATLKVNKAPDVTAGWLELGKLYHENANKPQQLIDNYRFWKTIYPKHPVFLNLPETFTNAENFQITYFRKVAVLLPLTGQLSGPSKIIQNGLIAANSETEAPLTLTFYDTNATPDDELVKAIITEGNDIVLGPLQKEKIPSLINKLPNNIPIVTLNRVDELPYFPHVFQFSLSPEDELLQIAQHAHTQNYHQTWMIVPDNDFGERLKQSFSEIWSSFDGQVTHVVKLSSEANLDDMVQNLLAVSKSNQRKRTLQGLLGRELKFKARRRKDADFILMAIPAPQARQIKPLLNFHFAGDIPIYGNSMLSNHYADNYLDKDMNGIMLTEVPLLVTEPEMLEHYRQQWPNFFGSQARLFAFGHDAYHLVSELSYLQSFDQYKYQGLTGDLSLDSQNHVQRELIWSIFKNGQLVQSNESIDNTMVLDSDDDDNDD